MEKRPFSVFHLGAQTAYNPDLTQTLGNNRFKCSDVSLNGRIFKNTMINIKNGNINTDKKIYGRIMFDVKKKKIFKIYVVNTFLF